MSSSKTPYKPQRLAEILGHVLHEQGLAPRLHTHRVIAYWAEFAGEEIARRSRAVSLEEGTLHVVVDSPAWMQELHMRKDSLKEKINEKLGSEEVQVIRLRLGPVDP